ncbi:MAG: hypothetical protein K0S27_1043 [Gammaproteobacteria bacterium]|jgi:hypothetical protein|nr:hypothetical protein [Gammaproteobacteria bacterium]
MLRTYPEKSLEKKIQWVRGIQTEEELRQLYISHEIPVFIRNHLMMEFIENNKNFSFLKKSLARIAIKRNDVFVIDKLANYDLALFSENINAAPERNTLIHIAATGRHHNVLRELAKRDPALFNVKNDKGETPQHLST